MRKKIGGLLKKILKIRKRFLIPGIIVILAGLFLLTHRGSQKQAIQYQAVKKEDLEQVVSASGVIAGRQSANLKFQSGGKLAYVNVKLGDHVTTGEIIAGLDAQNLLSSLGQAQNNLRSAQTSLEKTLDDIHLFQYGNGGFANVGSPNETETQKEARTSAEVARDNAQEQVNAAQDALSNAVLYSPIDGTVTTDPPIPGVTVGPTDIVAQISNLSSREFDADVDESDIGQVKTGQKVQFTLNAYGDKEFSGTVFQIDPTTHNNSSGETVVTVKVTADNPSIKSIAGLNGQADIIVAQRKNVLAIPNDAIRNDNTVFVKTPSGIKSKKVHVLFQTDTDSEVEGLNEGDQIVVNPQAIPANQRG